jgi:cytochrome c2
MKKMAWGIALVGILIVAAPMARAGSASGAPSADPVKGEQVYKAQKCSVCHRIGNTGGKMGPDLNKVGATRDKAWLAAYLANPKGENPKNKMPAVKVKGADLDNLVDYLLTLK